MEHDTHGPYCPSSPGRPPSPHRPRLHITHLKQSSRHQRPQHPLDPTTRFGQPLLLDWTPKDQSPHTENIEIYTNTEEVELFLNDKSLGKQKLHADASPITYQVPFEPGTLEATARTGNRIVAQDYLRTAGKPHQLVLSMDGPDLEPFRSIGNGTGTPLHPYSPVLTPDWNDVTYATATLVDSSGTVIPDSTTVIHFSTTGPAKIIAVDNGNLLDHDPFQAPTPEKDRKLYEGHAIAILRATAASGAITLTATSEGNPGPADPSRKTIRHGTQLLRPPIITPTLSF